MSGGLRPSKSTLYVSNLPFSLTNNDLHKVFEKFGRVAKVTVVKDKMSRESKGIAFVLYVDRTSARKAATIMNNRELFGRKLKCSIAKDNGRAKDFIKRKIYKDKSFCYECGEEGHLSYNCPKNTLGERQQPEQKKRKRKQQQTQLAEVDDDHYSDYSDDYTLSDAIRQTQQQEELPTHTSSPTHASSPTHNDPSLLPVTTQQYSIDNPLPAGPSEQLSISRKRLKQDSYFSDEDASDSN